MKSYKYKQTNMNIETQTYKYKHTNTNIQIQTDKYKHANEKNITFKPHNRLKIDSTDEKHYLNCYF